MGPVMIWSYYSPGGIFGANPPVTEFLIFYGLAVPFTAFFWRVRMLLLKIIGLAFFAAWGYGMLGVSPRNAIGEVIAMSLFISVPWLYLLPTIEANQRKKPNVQSVALVNVLLGWSLIGWVVAMVMALKDHGPVVAVIQEASAWDTKICPHCAETVKAAAKVCKHCHGELAPVVAVSSTSPEVSGDSIPSFVPRKS